MGTPSSAGHVASADQYVGPEIDMATGILDYELVRTLITISETGSFTTTGQQLGLTQQAISAQIKRLEAMVGRRLTERRGQKSFLTPDGAALVAFAHEAMLMEERVRRHFASVTLAGRVRLGLVEGFAFTILPAVLAALRQEYPDLELIVETGRTELLLTLLDAGKIDVVLGAQRPGENLGDTLFSDRLRWVGDSVLLQDSGRPLPLVTLPAPSLVRSLTIEALARSSRSFAIIFESASYGSRQAAIVAGLGIGTSCRAFGDAPGSLSDEEQNLPPLGDIEFFLRIAGIASMHVKNFTALLQETIIDDRRGWYRPGPVVERPASESRRHTR